MLATSEAMALTTAKVQPLKLPIALAASTCLALGFVDGKGIVAKGLDLKLASGFRPSGCRDHGNLSSR